MTLSNFTILLKSSNIIQYYPQLLKFGILYVSKNLNLNLNFIYCLNLSYSKLYKNCSSVFLFLSSSKWYYRVGLPAIY